MKKTASLLVIFSAIIIAIVATNRAADAAAQDKAKSSGGKAVFQAQCAKCHAEDGKGISSLPDMPNFTDAKWQASTTDKHIIEVINAGAGIMPGFKEVLSAADVRALVRQVRSFGPASAKAKGK